MASETVAPDRPTRIAVLGCGFWAQFQIAAWHELPGARVTALYNRTRGKAEALAQRFGVAASSVYDDAAELLRRERGQIDAVDVITDVDTHARFVHLAAEHRVPVICQKPMAPDYATAKGMVEACAAAGVPYFVHENWRWQAPLRALKRVLASGAIGTPFRARVDFVTGFDVFANQPFLRTLEQFILTDMGSHVIDAARFLFGDATSLYCQTRRVHADIKGEDVATVVMRMGGAGTTVTCSLAYAGTPLEHDRFPETFVRVEGDRGSAELGPDYWVRVTTADGTHARRHPPHRYDWADPRYDVVQASIVSCNADLLRALRGDGPAETTGADNLRTVRLVFAAYESAAADRVVRIEA
jgi:predicted dehydrogenase